MKPDLANHQYQKPHIMMKNLFLWRICVFSILVSVVLPILLAQTANANGTPFWQVEIRLPPNETGSQTFLNPKVYVSRNADWEQLTIVYVKTGNTFKEIFSNTPETGTQTTELSSSAEWRTFFVRMHHKTGGFVAFKDWCPSEVMMRHHGPNEGYPESSSDGRPLIIVIGSDDGVGDHDFDDLTLYLTYDNHGEDMADIKPWREKYAECGFLGSEGSIIEPRI